MHELSIASAIMESVLDLVVTRSIEKVLSIKVAIGEFSHVEPDQLRFCYSAITEQTPIEGSLLEIETDEAVVECDGCSYRGRPKFWDEALLAGAVPTMQCPNCGATVRVVAGHDCAIRSIRFTTHGDEPVHAKSGMH